MKIQKFKPSTRLTYASVGANLIKKMQQTGSMSVAAANKFLKNSGGSSTVIAVAKEVGLIEGVRKNISIVSEHRETSIESVRQLISKKLKSMSPTRQTVATKNTPVSKNKRIVVNKPVAMKNDRQIALELAKKFSKAGDNRYALELMN